MTATVHAIYPKSEGATFDTDYYVKTHVPMVHEVFGPHGLQAFQASKGLAGGPDAPPAYFVVATLSFPDMETLQAALAHGGPVIADIANFYSGVAQLLIGETL